MSVDPRPKVGQDTERGVVRVRPKRTARRPRAARSIDFTLAEHWLAATSWDQPTRARNTKTASRSSTGQLQFGEAHPVDEACRDDGGEQRPLGHQHEGFAGTERDRYSQVDPGLAARLQRLLINRSHGKPPATNVLTVRLPAKPPDRVNCGLDGPV